jgi:ATP-dependent DNA helicase UvrD/PcrA
MDALTLNPQQKKAVESEARLIVAAASPASGKTRVLTERIKHFASTDIIACMTFSNSAAYEMRKRLGDVADRLAFLGTLHSYSFKLIQRFGHLIGYKSGQVAILPDGERIPRLLAVREKLGLKMISQEKLLARHETAELIWKEYEFLLKRSNLCDFDGILREGAELLLKAEVLESCRLDQLLVDEAQDSAKIDWLIYERIPATHKFFTGDDDQSVYQFRGADPGGFLDLTLKPDVEVIKLECNYRSDISICEGANRLIAHNRMRVEKHIVPVSQEAGVVVVASFEDPWQELTNIERVMRAALARGNSLENGKLILRPSMAVLCRTNFEAVRIYNFLYGQGLPVKRQRYVQHPLDWQRAILLLSLAAAPDNEILIERYLKLDNPPGIVDQWLLESKAGGTEFASRIHHVLAPTLHKAPRFLAENGVGEITIGLIQQRVKLLPDDATVPDLLQDLYAHEETQREEGEGIYVGTMHSSKGREFDVVFLPAFEEGTIPRATDDDKPTMEEERRLAFVAVTRAKHELYISWAAARQFQWGGSNEMKPSRFIGEMGL